MLTHNPSRDEPNGTPDPRFTRIDRGYFDKRMRKFLPGYMTMGQDGIGDMGDMGMKIPMNSVPMVGAPGPYDDITMGGTKRL